MSEAAPPDDRHHQEAARSERPADEIGPPPDVAADEVDEASWESFPASDAPAWRDHEREESPD